MASSSKTNAGTGSLIQIFPSVNSLPLVNTKPGAWVCDLGSAEISDQPYTGGIFVKDELAQDLDSDSFPVNEWKYILEGEWHMVQNGKKLIAKAGDVVFVPKGAAFLSLKNPFKAFFVTNRGGVNHEPYAKAKL
ncbi:hypothetical protein L486_06310 [Kwoniella mangroviensis CBS 10435]|uniref:(S)-ureidoglycine aminohydrolase cupin domain-containing protein n=1 Tax=Kwoniella mangroviensis CBS 10435 TaxID=1331196 RepID=A0A1B9ILI3_9TREE|nr:hypothetical protein L486_06310 [Kwoniella mangroviensis CBS 10435]OCF79117.1 hypothetical protein I204_01063 [Kwoniella mangroviensis CBS 8886]